MKTNNNTICVTVTVHDKNNVRTAYEIKEWFNKYKVDRHCLDNARNVLRDMGYEDVDAITSGNSQNRELVGTLEFWHWFLFSKSDDGDGGCCDTHTTPNFKVGDKVMTKDGKLLTIKLLCFNIGNSKYYAHFEEIPIVISTCDLTLANDVEYKPKDGEFYVMEKTESGCKCILCGKYWFGSGVSDSGYKGKYHSPKIVRPATEKEKQELISAVENEYGCTWDGKEWVNILNVGDIVIAWYDEHKCEAVIGVLSEYNEEDDYPYRVGDFELEYAVKFSSMEQYYDIIGK